MKRVIGVVLSTLLVCSMLVFGGVSAMVNVGDDLGYNKVVSTKKFNVAPGITETDVVLNTDDGSLQNKVFSMEVDLSNPNVGIIAGYKDYQGTEWGFQTVRNQAKAAEKALKQNSMYGDSARIVGGINGSWCNVSTGEPYGALVMNGVIMHEEPMWNLGGHYIAILKDKTAEIRDVSVPIGDDVLEAVAGAELLVKDGVNQMGETHEMQDREPRSAIGIKEDGKVVFFVVDGRQAPNTYGMTYHEVAEALIGLGCKDGMILDGGGSSTFLSRREGSENVDVVNSPSDGFERLVSSSILIVSTAKPSGVFDHASISPYNEYYTPESQISFEAKGADSSGASVAIPEGAKWRLNADSTDYGTIDETTGVFVSNGTTGVVHVELLLDNSVVGSTTINIVSPDSISFVNDEISLGFEESTDLGLLVRSDGIDVHYKDDDFVWTMSDSNLGSFNGNLFTSSDGQSLNGIITATSKYDESVSGSINVVVGMLPTIVMDFEDYVNPDTGEIIPAEEYYTIGSNKDDTNYKYAAYGEQFDVKGSAEIVSIDDEEPVRFGSHALKMNFDFTEVGDGTKGMCFGSTNEIAIPGSPTGIGVWVYVPEDVKVEWGGQGTPSSFWLRGLAYDGNGNRKYYDYTLQPSSCTSPDQQPGLYWEGWKYLEADLTESPAPFTIKPGTVFRLMYVPGINMGSKTAGSIYFDNLQFVYGANVDDVDSPEISKMTINGEPITDGMTIKTNKNSFGSEFYDVYNKYTSGIDVSTIRMFIDGVNVVDNPKYNYVLDSDATKNFLYDVELLNGEHSITVSLKDNFGNETSETHYFTVAGEEQNVPKMTVNTSEENAILGEILNIQVEFSDISKIDAFSTTIKLAESFKDYDVKISENFNGHVTYNKMLKTINIDGKKNETVTSDDTVVATVSVNIPSDLNQNTKFSYIVKSAAYSIGEEEYTYSKAESFVPIKAVYTIQNDPIIVGKEGILTVVDIKGNATANVGIYTEEGELIGQTDDNGSLVTNYFSSEAGKSVIYAKDENNKSSFMTTIFSYDAVGEASQPFGLLNNAVKDPASQKSISWMVNPLVEGKQQIQYRKVGESTWTTIDAESKIQTFNYEANNVAKLNSVILSGLDSNTTYEYRVGCEAGWSDVESFITVSNEPINFFVLGDIQAADLTNITAITDDIASKNYTFGIQTGDAVDSAISFKEWANVTELLGVDKLSDSDMIHVLGNHEYATDLNSSISSSIFNLPEAKPGSYYSTTYGNVYVAVINYTTSDAQLQEALHWIREDALKSNAKWKVLTMHQPSYYTNIAGGNSQINALVPPVVDEVGFDVVFSGHDHAYARTAPIKNRVVDQNGTVYFIAGSSGEKSYAINNNPDFHFEMVSQDYNGIYISVEANYNELNITTYNVAADGTMEIFDSCTIESERCENDEHNYLYDLEKDQLICEDCGYVIDASDSFYAGSAREKDSKRYMMFASGTPLTGYQFINSTHYYFDKTGLGFEGAITICGEECIFKDGQYISCTTNDIYTAGMCGDNIGFILDKNGTLKLDGTGGMFMHKTSGTVPWHEYRDKIWRIEIGKDITSVGSYSFSFAQSCREVEIEKGSQLKTIYDLGFYFMSNLKEIDIPEGVTTIERYAFAYDNGLGRVYLPKSVSYISDTAFNDTNNARLILYVYKDSYAHQYAQSKGLQYIIRDEDPIGPENRCGENAYWNITSDGVLKIYGVGELYPFYETGEASIPWYNQREKIQKVTVGKDITVVSTYSFKNLTNCTSVEFEEGSKLVKLGSDSFRNMAKLKELTLPEGLKTIGNCTFANTGLEEIYIPASVTTINKTSFYGADKNKLVLTVEKDSYGLKYAQENGLNYATFED